MADLESRAFLRRGDKLVPADFVAEEFLASLAEGDEVLITVRRPRSIQHHRWFFALLRAVVRQTRTYYWKTEEDLLEDLKDAAGHVERAAINPLTGLQRRRTRSIAFASMGQDKFRRFVDRCMYVVEQRLHLDVKKLMAEADNIVARPSLWIAPLGDGKHLPPAAK